MEETLEECGECKELLRVLAGEIGGGGNRRLERLLVKYYELDHEGRDHQTERGGSQHTWLCS